MAMAFPTEKQMEKYPNWRRGPVAQQDILLSDKDRNRGLLKDFDSPFKY